MLQLLSFTLRNRTAATERMTRQTIDFPMVSEDNAMTYVRMQWIDRNECDAVLCTVAYTDLAPPTAVACTASLSTFRIEEDACCVDELLARLATLRNVSIVGGEQGG